MAAPDSADAAPPPWRDRPARWLVTGGAGFIGSHLVQHLLRQDQTVVVLDDLSSGSHEKLAAARGDTTSGTLTLVEGDIRNHKTVASAMRDVDYVLHHAARGSVPESLKQPQLYHDVNVDGTVAVFEAARHQRVRGLVYASSAAVYGDDTTEPKVETTIGVPLSPYALGKRVGEQYAELMANAYGFPAIGLRYFNVVGPRQDPNGAYAAVVPRWLERLAVGEAPTIYGDGLTTRDFCPVSEIVRANLAAATHATPCRGRVYNIGLGQRTSLNALATILRDGMARRGAPCADVQPTYEDFRPGDIRHSHASIERATEQLGFAPQVSVAEGLQPAMDAAAAASS